MTITSHISSLTLGALFLLLPSLGMAQDAKLFQWQHGKAAAMVTTANGALIIHKDGKPFRAFNFKPNKSKLHPSLIVTDIDRDGTPEIIGVGKPTFAISAKGNPLWNLAKGCKQGFLADVANDTKLEFICTSAREIKAFTHDAQFLWSASLGRSFKDCRAGDTNGDLKADVECKVGKKFARLDGTNGKLITGEGDESLIPDKSNYDMTSPQGTSDMEGKTMHDFNKDGTAEESLSVSGNTLALVSKSSPKKPIAVIDLKDKPLNAMVQDLDGDGKLEIIAITKKRYFVISADGKRQESYPLALKKYKRQPVAEFEAAYATNFKDNDAASKSIKAMKDKFSKCYLGALKKSKFAGSGKLLMEAKFNEKGKAIKASKIHSQIADKKVVKCALGVLKKAKIMGAKEGAPGNMNITMTFTFRDVAK